ncbi:MAG: hypothetical protein FJ098_11425 [Deltaproteobacteria bacterium]|nr:hypothetical protein [Deltaproteobacteria bacterium]
MSTWEEIRRERGIPGTRVFTEPELIAPMEAYLTPCREALDRLLWAFDHDLYVFGGPPRDVIRYVLEGIPRPRPADLDVFLDDGAERIPLDELTARVRLAGLGEPVVFEFGGAQYVQVKGDFELEIFPFSRKFVYMDYPEIPVTVDATLGAIDLNTSSACYDLRRKRLLSCGAYEGVRDRQVEVHYVHPLGVRDTLVRLVSHAGRFGYRLGPRAVALIRREFDPAGEEDLRNQVLRKHPELDLAPLLETLRRIRA